MSAINLTAQQAMTVATIIRVWAEGSSIWLHGSIESVYLSIETKEGKTIAEYRIFEDGSFRRVGDF